MSQHYQWITLEKERKFLLLLGNINFLYGDPLLGLLNLFSPILLGILLIFLFPIPFFLLLEFLFQPHHFIFHLGLLDLLHFLVIWLFLLGLIRFHPFLLFSFLAWLTVSEFRHCNSL